MEVMRWVNRTFEFSMAAGMFPVVVERLRGTPARMEEKLRGVAPGILTQREGERWSIQEHAGHLLDLDELHRGRLDDYLAGAIVLRPADKSNRKTYDANHNARPLKEILVSFRRERGEFVAHLECWKDEDIVRTALHPRLKQPMRVIDMAFFVAEHDDHHLALMTERLRRIGVRLT